MKNKDFQIIYKEGKSYANKYLVMYIRENNTDQNRLGISVSKKVGNSIVRHRLTRLIRESYRLQEEHFKVEERTFYIMVTFAFCAVSCNYYYI